MHDTRDPALHQSYLAEQGVIVERKPSNYLFMNKGHIIRRTDKDEPAQVIVFDKYAVDLDQFEKKFNDDGDLKPRERYLSELLNPKPDSAAYKKSPGQFRAELHERFANPFYPIAFVFIALAAVGQAHSTRQNRVQQVATAFVVAAALRLGGLAINNVVVISAAATPLMYGLPAIGIIGSLILMERSRRRLTVSRFPGVVLDPIADGIGRLAGLMRRMAGRTRPVPDGGA